MTRILHLTDVHFGGEDPAPTAAALAFAQTYDPALIVFSGDLTLNGLPREFVAGRAWLDRLPRPWLHTPGNHDTPYWNLLLRALVPFARYRRWVGDPAGGGHDGEGFAVRMINTARGAQPRPDWSKGAINLEACKAAAQALEAASPAGLRIVSCHHPLVEATGAPVSGGVHRGELAAALMAERGVDLILTGHVHTPFAVPLAAGDGLTYAVGAGTLSLRTRGVPPAFNTITWTDETVEVTAQAWAGSAFEPFRAWSLPRRRRSA